MSLKIRIGNVWKAIGGTIVKGSIASNQLLTTSFADVLVLSSLSVASGECVDIAFTLRTTTINSVTRVRLLRGSTTLLETTTSASTDTHTYVYVDAPSQGNYVYKLQARQTVLAEVTAQAGSAMRAMAA